jgi:hypothetical protein
MMDGYHCFLPPSGHLCMGGAFKLAWCCRFALYAECRLTASPQSVGPVKCVRRWPRKRSLEPAATSEKTPATPPRSSAAAAAVVCVQEEVATTGEQDAYTSADDDQETYCEACGDHRRSKRLLLCDSCPRAFHTFCLTPVVDAVPEGDWFCPVRAFRLPHLSLSLRHLRLVVTELQPATCYQSHTRPSSASIILFLTEASRVSAGVPAVECGPARGAGGAAVATAAAGGAAQIFHRSHARPLLPRPSLAAALRPHRVRSLQLGWAQPAVQALAENGHAHGWRCRLRASVWRRCERTEDVGLWCGAQFDASDRGAERRRGCAFARVDGQRRGDGKGC